MRFKISEAAMEALKEKEDKEPAELKKVRGYLSSLDKKASNACQRFAAALELKFRGVDKTVNSVNGPLDLVFDTPVGCAYPIQNWCLFKNVKYTPITGNPVDCITKTMTSWGNGARAMCWLKWKSGRGHVFNLLNIEGEIYLADASANRLKLVKDSDYVKNMVDAKASPGFFRTDKGSPDKDLIEDTFAEPTRCFSFRLENGDRVRQRATFSVLHILNMFARKRGDVLTIARDDKVIGKVVAQEVVETYGEHAKHWSYRWQ